MINNIIVLIADTPSCWVEYTELVQEALGSFSLAEIHGLEDPALGKEWAPALDKQALAW